MNQSDRDRSQAASGRLAVTPTLNVLLFTKCVLLLTFIAGDIDFKHWCTLCGYGTWSTHDLRLHQRASHSVPLTWQHRCLICKFETCANSQMEEHVESAHMDVVGLQPLVEVLLITSNAHQGLAASSNVNGGLSQVKPTPAVDGEKEGSAPHHRKRRRQRVPVNPSNIRATRSRTNKELVQQRDVVEKQADSDPVSGTAEAVSITLRVSTDGHSTTGGEKDGQPSASSVTGGGELTEDPSTDIQQRDSVQQTNNNNTVTGHDDTERTATGHDDTEHTVTGHDDTEHTVTVHDDTEHTVTVHDDTEHTSTGHDDAEHMGRSCDVADDTGIITSGNALTEPSTPDVIKPEPAAELTHSASDSALDGLSSATCVGECDTDEQRRYLEAEHDDSASTDSDDIPLIYLVRGRRSHHYSTENLGLESQHQPYINIKSDNRAAEPGVSDIGASCAKELMLEASHSDSETLSAADIFDETTDVESADETTDVESTDETTDVESTDETRSAEQTITLTVNSVDFPVEQEAEASGQRRDDSPCATETAAPPASGSCATDENHVESAASDSARDLVAEQTGDPRGENPLTGASVQESATPNSGSVAVKPMDANAEV